MTRMASARRDSLLFLFACPLAPFSRFPSHFLLPMLILPFSSAFFPPARRILLSFQRAIGKKRIATTSMGAGPAAGAGPNKWFISEAFSLCLSL